MIPQPSPAWSVGPPASLPDVTVGVLIAGWATRQPDAVAVRQWDDRVTYAELANRSGLLATRLRDLGMGPGDRVGICLRRSPDLVVALLGVLRSGAAYVPLEPRGQPARAAEILDDAGIDVVVVDDATADVFGHHRRLTVPAAAGEPVDLACPARLEHPAYVIYTSGSTGRPKGVVVSHRALLAFIVGFGGFIGADARTRSLGFASLTFDVSIEDLLLPLAMGGQVCLAGDTDRTDPARLQRFAAEHAVTSGYLPPSLLPILDPAELPTWRVVATGGESPGPEQVHRWAGSAPATRRRFINGYGQTETAVCATAFVAAGHWDRPVPMGRPLPNYRAYVVDSVLAPAPVGVPGELLIGGAGLAQGYLNRPGLTALRFIPDPFGDEPGSRLYRTGDRALWRPDGTLLFLGRDDDQVKIRGQRVEPGEVEAALCARPDVQQAAVQAHPGSGGLELVAFCTPLDGADGDAVRAWCAQRLPSAMVPARVIRLAGLPLNHAGKVDRTALRALASDGAGRSRPADGAGRSRPADGSETRRPETAVQRAVGAAWRDVLGAEAVDLSEDFFLAGGHSITAMRLVAALRQTLGRDVSVEDVLAGRTLGRIAERAAGAPTLSATEVSRGHAPELSSAQLRLWFVDKLAPGLAAYNIALVERLDGWLDADALRAALAKVAERHEVLRWRIPEVGGVPVVTVLAPDAAGPLVIDDLRGVDPAARELAVRAALDEMATSGFNLAEGPLWRSRLFRVADAEHLLAITFHHAVFDGWSQRPYYADLSRAYAAAITGGPGDVAEPPVQYADYVAWRKARDTERGAADLAWWREHLAGAPNGLDLPADRPRPAVQTYRGARERASLAPETTATVRALAVQLGATVPAVLLAGFGHVVNRLTDATDIVVGTPAVDRRQVEFHDLVGLFLDVVPLRLRCDPGEGFATSVRAATAELLDALAHPVALERIVETVGVRREPSRPPLVQVLFNAYSFPEPRLDLPGVRAFPDEAGLPGSPFDLTVYVVERDGTYGVEMLYNTDLFDAERVRTMLDGYVTLLDRVCADPATPVDTVALPDLRTLRRVASADLPAPPVSTSPAALATATEHLVAMVWCEVLKRASVGATDNFFDVGGTSVAIVAVQSRLGDLTGRSLSVVDLFRYPTVRALAGLVDGADGRSQLQRGAARAAARRDRARARTARNDADRPPHQPVHEGEPG